MRLTLISCVLLVSFIAPCRSQGILGNGDSKQDRRVELFGSLYNQEADAKASHYFGYLLNGPIDVNSYDTAITGRGPLGYLSLNLFGTMVTGNSGGRLVNLHAMGYSVTGQGPRGNVNLRVSPSFISGYVGVDNVSVSVLGGMATGTIGGSQFYLNGGGPLKALGLACLIGAI